MISSLRMHLRAIGVTMAERLAYRGDFFIGLFIMLVGDCFGPLVAVLIYRTGASFPGWGLYEVLCVQALFLLVKGIAHSLFFNIGARTIEHIRRGTFDLFLIKPRPALHILTAFSFDPESIGSLLGGLGLLIFIRPHLPTPGFGLIVSTLLYMFLALGVMFAFALIISGIAFKWLGGFRMYEIFTNMTLFGLYPRPIFSRSIRFIISFILPVALIGYMPAAALLGRAVEGLPLTAGIAVAFLSLALFFWRSMLKTYTSAGG